MQLDNWNGALITGGLGLILGLVIGALLPLGVWPVGVWTVFAAFIAASMTLIQIQQNAEHARRAKREEWSDQQVRVLRILLGEISAILDNHKALLDMAPDNKVTLDGMLERHIGNVEKWKQGLLGNKFPEWKMTPYYLPEIDFYYFKEHPEALEYLPTDILSEFIQVKAFIATTMAYRSSEQDLEVLVHTFETSIKRAQVLFDRMTRFQSKIRETSK